MSRTIAIALALAFAAPVAAEEPPAYAVAERADNTKYCVAQTRAMIPIMDARQAGIPKATLLKSSTDAEFKAVVTAIYESRRGKTEKEQKELAKEFALLMFATCLNEMNGKQ